MSTQTPSAGRAVAALGHRLRSLREAAGLSGVALAAQLGPGWGQSKVSKVETGRQLPTVEEIEAWASATGGDSAALMTLRTKASAEYGPWKDRLARAGGPTALQDELTALARSCTFLGEYQGVVVPGYLQTPAYMREMALGDEFVTVDGIDATTLDHVVAAKVRRQSILYEPGRDVVHVVGEAVLRSRYGRTTLDTQRTQLRQLAELATLPRHTFGVIPFTTAVPVAAGGFSLYDRDLVVVETIAGDLQLTEPEVVARYARWLDQLLDAALTGARAADFCRAVARELGGPPA